MTPVGAVLPYAGPITDETKVRLKADGFLFCNGEAYLKEDYPELFSVIKEIYGKSSTTSFYVPDYRGLFMRGCDVNRGMDPDKVSRTEITPISDKVGSRQDDTYRSHSHWVGNVHHRSFCGQGGSDKPIKNCSGDNYYTSSSGGNETRPKNIYVNYIICFESYPVYEKISQYVFPFLMSVEYGFRDINTIIPSKQMSTEEPLSISLKGDSSFKKITVKYKSFTFSCGMDSGTEQELKLDSGEYITKVQGVVKNAAATQKELSYLCVETSKGRKLESSGKSIAGTGFTLACDGKKIVGFYGSENANRLCCSIGAYYKDI